MNIENTAAGKSLKAILDCFQDKFIISLKHRLDRRQRIRAQLTRYGIDFDLVGLEWFDGLIFDDAAGFPNIGVRGCFMSHYALLRICAENNRPMLILEDDIAFDTAALATFDEVHKIAEGANWDLIYLGYLKPDSCGMATHLTDYRGDTIGGHFYAVQPSMAARMVTFMEQCILREPGDPNGGPMYRDGAFGFYRQRHADVRTLLATPSLAGQFSSRSDLKTNLAIYEKIPGIRGITEFARKIKFDFI